MSFRILNQAPQFLLPDGRVNAGGSLTFYETDLSTPKPTWSDPDMTTPNANPVAMDSAGRTVTDVWGDGEYGVVMKDAGGVTIWTRNNVRDSANPGAEIPALVAGQYLTNDGSVLTWQPVLQVPDPTGSDGYILSTDGVNPIWIPQPTIPEPPAPDIEIDTGSRVVKIGAGGSVKYVTMTGTGSAPASGQWTTSAAISFPEGFDSLWNVLITIRTDRVSTADSGFLPGQSVTGWTPGSASSGVTANFVLCEDDRSPPNRFNFAVPFSWTAIGTITE